MDVSRRLLLGAAASGMLVRPLMRRARAQTWPARPVRIFLGFGPGSTPDINARLIAQWLSERLGAQFIVENRPGAGGNLAAEAAIRAPADGYALLWVNAASAVNQTLYDKLKLDLARDIAPVAGITTSPQVMVVHPSFPATTVAAFIAYAKANPGRINMASSGTGNLSHVSGELFKMMAGVDMLHVPYRGATPALTDLIGGQVQVMFDALPSSIGHIKAGELRALAVTSAERWAAIPQVPTVAETVWSGIAAPKGTAAEIVGMLNREINAGLADENIRALLSALGGMPLPGSAADFAALIFAEVDKWARVIRFAGIKAE
jgi:tripartite-type tricarboxylate transporter receptor subunit TctC